MRTESYPIGKPGTPWTHEDKKQWLALQSIKRSYTQDVIFKLNDLSVGFEVLQYGALSFQPERYPLFLIKTRQFDSSKPTALITGGVHGYETSGVQGALDFALHHAKGFVPKLNLIIAPCISPWGYETVNRWNPNAQDPNRSFFQDSGCEEANLIMAALAKFKVKPDLHIDLHETTDTDNTEFRPALAARDAIEQKSWDIPDGFYLVGDTQKPQDEFQQTIIRAVEKVTHIAPADANGKIIGDAVSQPGVINYDKKKLYLCAGMTNADYVTTTEVYPDSAKTTPDNCVDAQVTAVITALNFLLESNQIN